MMTATMTMMMMAVVVVVTANSFRCCFVHTRSPFYLHSLMWVFKSLCHMKYTNTSTACGEFYWRHVHPCFSWKLRVISPRHQTGSRHGVRSYKNLQQQQVFQDFMRTLWTSSLSLRFLPTPSTQKTPTLPFVLVSSTPHPLQIPLIWWLFIPTPTIVAAMTTRSAEFGILLTSTVVCFANEVAKGKLVRVNRLWGGRSSCLVTWPIHFDAIGAHSRSRWR